MAMQPLEGQLSLLTEHHVDEHQVDHVGGDHQGDEHQVVRPALLSWRGFTADHPRAEAVASFRQRFGRDPEQVLQNRGLLLLGPV